ncbi:MAG TPA: 50S ribosomal protein L5 [Thermotogota bacterium]|nr:50S ribosomal protein L5 [Thermotogota bacterium]HPJ88167.1 50S ribosomal protein L5 [Thermotogota bacterium]HPR95600.1 50S ribosomal protein L5 [Thermotogota bacterium]
MAKNEDKANKPERITSYLNKYYSETVAPAMMKEFGYKNVMQVPKLAKIVINMGVGEGSRNKDLFRIHQEELKAIAGQKPVVTHSKKAIANFKLRKGMPVGIKVTLRNGSMENFLYKLCNIVLPKVRDFRGLNPNSFDGRGNYAFGLSEQVIFPEVKPENVKRIQGMDIVIATTAKSNEEAKKLLELMGMPFKRG